MSRHWLRLVRCGERPSSSSSVSSWSSRSLLNSSSYCCGSSSKPLIERMSCARSGEPKLPLPPFSGDPEFVRIGDPGAATAALLGDCASSGSMKFGLTYACCSRRQRSSTRSRHGALASVCSCTHLCRLLALFAHTIHLHASHTHSVSMLIAAVPYAHTAHSLSTHVCSQPLQRIKRLVELATTARRCCVLALVQQRLEDRRRVGERVCRWWCWRCRVMKLLRRGTSATCMTRCERVNRASAAEVMRVSAETSTWELEWRWSTANALESRWRMTREPL